MRGEESALISTFDEPGTRQTVVLPGAPDPCRLRPLRITNSIGKARHSTALRHPPQIPARCRGFHPLVGRKPGDSGRWPAGTPEPAFGIGVG